MSARIIRRSQHRAVPWKNGGGITHELARAPADGEHFCWRLSVAQIDASGPFSDFAGYRRTMVLLRGAGLRLKFPAGAEQILLAVGECLHFDGALAAHCELLRGPCFDLNLMVHQAKQAHAWVQVLDRRVRMGGAGSHTALIFAIDAPLLLNLADGGAVRLEPWDLAILSNVEASDAQIERADCAAPSQVFVATISD